MSSNEDKQKTRVWGTRIFCYEIVRAKNATLYGEDVGALDALTFVTEESLKVVLELVEDAEESVTETDPICEAVISATTGASSVGAMAFVVETVKVEGAVADVSCATGATTGSNPLRYPVTTQSNSISDPLPPKLFTIK